MREDMGMIWMIAAILIIASFATGYVLGSTRSISVNITSIPKIDMTRKPLKAHNPDVETFRQAQDREVK